MASLTLTVDNTIVPRVLAAYQVSTAAELKAAIIDEVKAKVIRYEYIEKQAAENQKVKLAEEAAQVAAQKVKTDAESQIILT